jgi:hypothetical protein
MIINSHLTWVIINQLPKRRIQMRYSLITVLIVTVLATFSVATITANPLQGYLTGSGDIDKIGIETDETPVYAVFQWEEGMELWVRILGKTDNPLGDFNMAEGNSAELAGTGKFTLEVYSKGGSGSWQCVMMNKQDFDNSNK